MPTHGRPQDPAARPGARRATSVDVARHAGVSRATVSHILNDQVDRFAKTTVDRVRAAAAELGYVRSAAARALVKGRSDFVVLVVPPTTLSNLQDLVEVMTADLDELGFSVVVHFGATEAADAPPVRLRHLVQALRPAGLIDLGWVAAEHLADIQATGCPVISPTIGVAGTRDDFNEAIGRMQAEHLHGRGYADITYAFLSDQRDDPWGRQRFAGVAAVCAQRGPAPPGRVEVPLDPDGARAAVAAIVAGRTGAVGVACYSDEVAIALLFAAVGLGVRVPADMALVGLAHGPVGQVVAPRLTTVHTDLKASLGGIRAAVADHYGGTPQPATPPDSRVFTLTQGDTT